MGWAVKTYRLILFIRYEVDLLIFLLYSEVKI